MAGIGTEIGPGERIGRYEVIAHLATGGMGQVYLARSTGLGGFVRHVVLKTLDLPGTDENEAIAMFLDEARLLGLLHHQHIAPIYEVGKDDDGGLFLVMDYIHGETAHEVWQRTNAFGAALPIDFSLTVAASAASGLHYAHTRRDPEGASLRIVHRDVSLSNLMIGFDGAVKLIDFGIAKATNRSTQTQAGYIKGKLGYMAPEQLRGLAVDARTDVFALGIVLYELTTMRRAFREESDHATMERIRTGAFVLPSAINPAYPPQLEQIVTRALRIDPRERYPDAETMRRDLDLLGHQLGLVLGDAAILEVMSQLFEQRAEPWQRARKARPPSELDVPLEVSANDPADDSMRKTLPQMSLRTATQAAESQLDTPPHGIPKRPSAFAIDLGLVARPSVPNDTDGVLIAPPDPKAAARAATAGGSDAIPTVPVAALPAAAGAGTAGAGTAPVEPPPESKPTRPSRHPRAVRSAAKLPPGPRSRWRTAVIWIAVFLLVAGAVAGGLYLLEASGSSPAQAEGAEPTGAFLAPPPQVASPVPSAAPGPPVPAPASPPEEPAPKPPVARPPGAQLQLDIKTTPPDATVLLDGKRLGRTPYSGTIEAAAGKHTLKLRRKGYAPVTLEIPLDADLARDVTLQPAPAGTAPAAPTSSP